MYTHAVVFYVWQQWQGVEGQMRTKDPDRQGEPGMAKQDDIRFDLGPPMNGLGTVPWWDGGLPNQGRVCGTMT